MKESNNAIAAPIYYMARWILAAIAATFTPYIFSDSNPPSYLQLILQVLLVDFYHPGLTPVEVDALNFYYDCLDVFLRIMDA